MALFNCSECGYEFSDKADACPKCGCPNTPGGMTPIGPPPEPGKSSKKSQEPKKGCLVAVANLAVLVIAGGALSQFFNSEPKPLSCYVNVDTRQGFEARSLQLKIERAASPGKPGRGELEVFSDSWRSVSLPYTDDGTQAKLPDGRVLFMDCR